MWNSGLKIIFPQDSEVIFSLSFSIWCIAWEFEYNSNSFACTAPPPPPFLLWKFLHSLSWMLVDICDDMCRIHLFNVWAFSEFPLSVDTCPAGEVFLNYFRDKFSPNLFCVSGTLIYQVLEYSELVILSILFFILQSFHSFLLRYNWTATLF